MARAASTPRYTRWSGSRCSMSGKRPSLYEFAHLTPKKQKAFLDALSNKEQWEWHCETYSDEVDESLRKKLLGHRCPRLQRRLFDCLCDGELFWVPGSTGSWRRPLRWPPLTMWTDGLSPVPE